MTSRTNIALSKIGLLFNVNDVEHDRWFTQFFAIRFLFIKMLVTALAVF